MEPMVILAIVIAVAVVGWLALQAQRTQRLRSRQAGEYDRAVAELGRRSGEAELDARPSSGRANLEREVPAPVQRADAPIDSARTSRRLRDFDREVRP